MTGRIDEALAARREALDIWQSIGDVDEVGDTQRWLSRLSWFAGLNADAEHYAEAACATLAGHGTRDEAMALSNRAQLRCWRVTWRAPASGPVARSRCSTPCPRGRRSRTCGRTR